MTEIKMGIYRHYKGPLYQVQGLTHDANHEGRICVLYIGLEIDRAHLGPRLAVRDLEEFDGWLDRATKRFTYLGPVFTEDMLKPDITYYDDIGPNILWKWHTRLFTLFKKKRNT